MNDCQPLAQEPLDGPISVPLAGNAAYGFTAATQS